MKTYSYSVGAYERPFLAEAADTDHDLLFTAEKLNISTAHYAAGCEAITIFTSDDCSAPVIKKLSQNGIRYISLRSAGFDHVDLDSAQTYGIQVANVPAYSPYSVAEHAVAMLMTLNRKIIESRSLMEMQDFRLDTLTGFDVHGKTVGIVGTGKIGVAFASIMNGFGTTVLAYDPVKSNEALALGVTYVSLEELLRKSDIISIHCPLNEKTKYLFSNPQFSWMKKGCILINTARGGIIHTQDLIEAIENGRLGGVCLDVYEHEKGLFFEDHRATVLMDPLYLKLLGFKNVLITGHQGFLTVEALRGIARTTIHNLERWQHNEFLENELTHAAVQPAENVLAI
jgi:D-lactate dehydrogenase